MQKIQIAENIFNYLFPEEPATKLGFNILVLVDGQRALIIDTVYAKEARQIRNDLERNGIKPEIVVISHFHPDHIGGTKVFEDCTIMGSKHYSTNFENSKVWHPDWEFVKPSSLINDGDTLTFGSFSLRFTEIPGHSVCNLAIIINDSIMHVGDLIMGTNSGKLSLPLICADGSADGYISSLEKVKGLPCNTMVMGHGKIVTDKVTIEAILDDRLYYLTKLKQSNGTADLNGCLKKSPQEYEALGYHYLNKKNI